MAYNPGTLDTVLAAAIGDDPVLAAELRHAFLASAATMVESMALARGDADWQSAAWRLHGLAASFGATALMVLAAQAAEGTAGDRRLIGELEGAIALLGA